MPALQALLTLVTPVLLLKGCYEELVDNVTGSIHGDFLHFQKYRIPHHIEQFSSTWHKGHLMIWTKTCITPQGRMHPRVYRNHFYAFVCFYLLGGGASIMLIAPLAGGTIVRADEMIIQLLESPENQNAPVTSSLYSIVHWALYLPALCPLVMAFGFPYICWKEFRRGEISITDRFRKRPCSTGARACAILCVCILWPVVWLWVLAIVVTPPRPETWSQRQLEVLQAERGAIGPFTGVVFMTMWVLSGAIKQRVFLTLAGCGPVEHRSDFLKFCEEHPGIVQAFPELSELKDIAQTLQGVEEEKLDPFEWEAKKDEKRRGSSDPCSWWEEEEEGESQVTEEWKRKASDWCLGLSMQQVLAVCIITAEQTANVRLDTVLVSDNHIGVTMRFLRPTTDMDHRVYSYNMTVFGSTAASTCAASIDCRAYGEEDTVGETCNSVIG
ncbi:unnamed protein product, partial [Symbiodinium sp. CCMP2456]